MKRLARTRSEKRATHPGEGAAQCSVGSIEDEGIRYGLTTHSLMASTATTATTMVTTQSMIVGHGCGSPSVRRSTGPLMTAFFPGSAPAATSRCGHDLR